MSLFKEIIYPLFDKKKGDIQSEQFKHNVEMFVELLAMEKYFTTPVRQLSLGQRMRVEIALSMLHNPKILFLDEPTIGLDVVGKKYIRDFFKEINRINKTTIILTSHDMKDFENIVRRVILLNKGTIIFDGTLDTLKLRYSLGNEVIFTYSNDIHTLRHNKAIFVNEHQIKINYNPDEESLTSLIGVANQWGKLIDITIKPVDIEETIRTIYQRDNTMV